MSFTVVCDHPIHPASGEIPPRAQVAAPTEAKARNALHFAGWGLNIPHFGGGDLCPECFRAWKDEVSERERRQRMGIDNTNHFSGEYYDAAGNLKPEYRRANKNKT